MPTETTTAKPHVLLGHRVHRLEPSFDFVKACPSGRRLWSSRSTRLAPLRMQPTSATGTACPQIAGEGGVDIRRKLRGPSMPPAVLGRPVRRQVIRQPGILPPPRLVFNEVRLAKGCSWVSNRDGGLGAAERHDSDRSDHLDHLLSSSEPAPREGLPRHDQEPRIGHDPQGWRVRPPDTWGQFRGPGAGRRSDSSILTHAKVGERGVGGFLSLDRAGEEEGFIGTPEAHR